MSNKLFDMRHYNNPVTPILVSPLLLAAFMLLAIYISIVFAAMIIGRRPIFRILVKVHERMNL